MNQNQFDKRIALQNVLRDLSDSEMLDLLACTKGDTWLGDFLSDELDRRDKIIHSRVKFPNKCYCRPEQPEHDKDCQFK